MAQPERLLKGVILFLLAALFVVYFCRQAVSITNSPIETEIALAVTVSDKLEANGYIMRNERILDFAAPGICVACVENGEKISKGNAAVKIYMDEGDTEIENTIRGIDLKLKVLNNSSIDSDHISADISKIDDEIGGLLDDAAVYACENDLSGCISCRELLLENMNKRWLISNPGMNYTDKINELISQKNVLSSMLCSPTTCYATDSGYYFSDIDGYESIFSSEKVDGLSLKSFKDMMQSEPDEIPVDAVGKIVLDYKWYLACEIPLHEVEKMNIGEDYSVEFPYNNGIVIPMTLYSKVSDDECDDAVAVFSCVCLPDNFEYGRKQKVNIILSSHTGLKIPKKALRFINDIRGVYVLRGSDVVFELVKDIYSKDDFFLADMDKENYPIIKKNGRNVDEDAENRDDSEETAYYNPVSLYDLIIVNASNLKDGDRVN